MVPKRLGSFEACVSGSWFSVASRGVMRRVTRGCCRSVNHGYVPASPLVTADLAQNWVPCRVSNGFRHARAPGVEARPSASRPIKSIEVHHLVPRRHEITDELLLRIRAAVHFRERAKLRVGAKHEIDAGGSPLRFTGL